MQPLTDQGRQTIEELARRFGVSTDAVMALLEALVLGHGTMAQFNHRELGGRGQWMQGGMTMVGDMFNDGLKAKVDGLCSELSRLLAQQPFLPPAPVHSSQTQSQWPGGQTTQPAGAGGMASLFVPGAQGGSGSWWPGDLGFPNASGGQNHIRYAYFAGPRRLAVEVNGQVTVYDTLDHQIGGVSQQQSGGSSLTFTSQYGAVDVASLPIVSSSGSGTGSGFVSAPPQKVPAPAPPLAGSPPSAPASETDIFATIERLAALQQKGILTLEEFSAKKAELLGRL